MEKWKLKKKKGKVVKYLWNETLRLPFSRLPLRPLPDFSLATWDLGPLSQHHCIKDMLLMKISPYLSDSREINETDVKYVEYCNLQNVWDSSYSLEWK